MVNPVPCLPGQQPEPGGRAARLPHWPGRGGGEADGGGAARAGKAWPQAEGRRGPPSLQTRVAGGPRDGLESGNSLERVAT